MTLSTVTDATFADEVLGSELPVLVEFWATWCPPCRMLAPVLEQLATERAGTLAVRKINSDENPETTRKYQVMSLPTMLLFHHGKPIRVLVGAMAKARLDAELESALAGESEMA